VRHTGGDLSTPDSVRDQILPNPFPEMKATLDAVKPTTREAPDAPTIPE